MLWALCQGMNHRACNLSSPDNFNVLRYNFLNTRFQNIKQGVESQQITVGFEPIPSPHSPGSKSANKTAENKNSVAKLIINRLNNKV